MFKPISSPRPRLFRRIGRFRREEEGSMIIFALFLILVMLIVGGMAVDFMRFESNRARLQAALDRCLLSSADLDDPTPADQVMQDCFNKSTGIGELSEVEVVEGINARQVRASATMGMNTFFLRMVGIDDLTAPAGGGAIEAVSDIEVILVLDVSGSMGNNNRLVNLKVAAADFVRTLFADDDENRISIGIVPFNGQINLGQVLREAYNDTDQHGAANVNCLDLPAAAYAASDLSTSLPIPMTGNVDTWSTTTQAAAYYNVSANLPAIANMWCPASTRNIVMLPSRNQTALINRINSFEAIGATSINAGVRWGLEFLDPGTRPMFNTLSPSLVPVTSAGRPYAYDRENTMKVIVLMSDGENFEEERLRAGYRTGPSPIFRANSGGETYSIFHSYRLSSSNATERCRPYWIPHKNTWQARPWNGTDASNSACYSASDAISGATRQNWQDVWTNARMQWVAWQLYGRAIGGTNSTARTNAFNAAMNEFRQNTPTGTMDVQLQAICNMAKNQGVSMFTIAFEAPAPGQVQLAACASSPGHYFNAQGLQIATAFRAIAAQISRLRLTE